MNNINWLEITSADVRTREDELKKLLGQLDVPESRCDVTVQKNVSWLSRNLAVRNTGRPQFARTRELVNWLMRWHVVGKKICAIRP